MGMSQLAIRNLYTEHMRRNVHIPGMRREDVPPVVRYIGEAIPRSTITYSDVNHAILDDTIEREKLYFDLRAHHLEWKVFSYDDPPDLRDQLAQHGFEIGEEEAVLVLDINHLPDHLLPARQAHTPRQITDGAAMSAVLNAVQNPAFGNEMNDFTNEWILDLVQRDPDSLQFFVVEIDDQPVSAAWIVYMPDGNPFAGLYGGATRAEYRGRGCYTALIAARAAAAKARGVPYLTVDASAMSRPILEKIGFQYLASAWACDHTPRPRST